jgi:hypothetical protein
MIKKFKSWLKSKLITFLEIDKLTNIVDENNEIQIQNYRVLKDNLNRIETLNKRVVERNNILMKEFNISADINPYSNRSWAVISINGKPDYIRFINLANKDMHTIHRFLKQFEANNVTVDSPFQFKDMWKF